MGTLCLCSRDWQSRPAIDLSEYQKEILDGHGLVATERARAPRFLEVGL
jgi:hypothetical protein